MSSHTLWGCLFIQTSKYLKSSIFLTFANPIGEKKLYGRFNLHFSQCGLAFYYILIGHLHFLFCKLFISTALLYFFFPNQFVSRLRVLGTSANLCGNDFCWKYFFSVHPMTWFMVPFTEQSFSIFTKAGSFGLFLMASGFPT